MIKLYKRLHVGSATIHGRILILSIVMGVMFMLNVDGVVLKV